MVFCSLFSYNRKLSSKTNVTVSEINLSFDANAMQAVVERKNTIRPLPNHKEMTIVAFHKSVKIRIPRKRCPGAQMGVGVLSHVSNSQKRELIRKTWARNSCVFFLVAVVDTNTSRYIKQTPWHIFSVTQGPCNDVGQK